MEESWLVLPPHRLTVIPMQAIINLVLQGGVFVSTALTPYLDARLEIKYAARGARNPASDDNTGAYKLGLHYIDLPVLAALTN